MHSQLDSSQSSREGLLPEGEMPALESAPDAAALERKRLKKQGKVRAAWISFVGRILAHFIGAAATIALGLMFLQKYQEGASLAMSPTAAGVLLPMAGEREGFAGRTSVAVLPFENFSGDAAHDHVSDAVTEAVIAELFRTGELGVLSRTSSMSYRGQRKSMPEIARELGVAWLLEGSIVVSQGRARVIGQLVDASTDMHVWVGVYEVELRDVLSLQTELAPVIAREVDEAIALAERRRRLNADGTN